MSARNAGSCRGTPPSTRADPAVGLARPVSSRSRVDLPAPFGPTSALIRPSGTVTVQSLRAALRRYRLVSPLVSIAIASVAIGPDGSGLTAALMRFLPAGEKRRGRTPAA